MHLKVQLRHRQKLAYVYLRQSSKGQVRHHPESTARQYALKDLAVSLGWSPEQIRVLDQDLGHTARPLSQREGFKTLVTEVSLEKVGAVLAIEASRLSRAGSDWHRLLEICALTGTLIIDHDGCYDLAEFNDQLLLGLKGTMSQAELHLIRARLQGGKLQKAQRGHLRFPLAVGYGYGEEPGSMVQDPDEEVRRAVSLVFELLAQTGSAYGVVHHFTQHQLPFPKRAYGGAWQGRLIWGKLTHSRVLELVRNPTYAGAYAFGRYRGRKFLSSEGELQSKVQRLPMEAWTVLIRDHHPGYISWDQYLANQQILQENQTNQPERLLPSAAREGHALLQGLLLCGRCGRQLSPRYRGNGGIYPIYQCTRRKEDGLYCSRCVCLRADLVDEAVSQRVLTVLEPEQLELAVCAVQELERRSQALDQQGRMRLERLEYQAQLAQRRYEEVDPSNRLVAATLESRWNQALAELERAKEEEAEVRQRQGLELTAQKKAELLALAEDLPRLWRAPSTTAKDRKRMLRLLIKDITVERSAHERRAVLHIRWQGGALEDLGVDLPPRAADQVRYPEEIVARVRLLAQTLTDEGIAALLNQEQRRSAKGKPFSKSMIQWIRFRHQIPALVLKRAEELTVKEVAQRFGVSTHVVYYWIERGHLSYRRLNQAAPYWITLSPEEERPLQDWVAQSHRLNREPIPKG